MKQLVVRRGLEIVLVACVAHLCWLVYSATTYLTPGEMRSLRNSGFPETHIGRIHVDLSTPDKSVRLTWVGPDAAAQDTGRFRSSPGAGWGTNDCNDPVESNCLDSRCTPKGLRMVEGFADNLQNTPDDRYVTWIDKRRSIGFHSCPSVEPYPASAGCVRLDPYAARLIHDNSIVGKTEILIDGTWTNPNRLVGGAKQ